MKIASASMVISGQQYWLVSARRLSLLALLLIGGGCTPAPTDPQRQLADHYQLQLPEGVGPFPAVMLIPGCSGFRSSPSKRAHFTRVASQLRSLGFIVVHVDYLAARELAYCHPLVSLPDIARDILSTAAYLQSRSDVRTDAIFVIGWSYGGGGALAALGAMSTNRPIPVRAVAAFYPVCVGIHPWRVNVPVLILVGSHDDQTPPQVCRELGRQLVSSQSIDIVLYSGAQHGFDIETLPTHRANPSQPKQLSTYDNHAAGTAWNAIEQFLRLYSTATHNAQ